MTNYKKVFTRWIAVELRKQGFNIIDVEPNHKKPQLDVYIFQDTPEFKQAFDNIKYLNK